MAIDWPPLDELKQVLDVDSQDWDGDEDGTRLTRIREAAIEKVKLDVGDWDEYVDVPDAMLSQAALRLAELIALKPEVAAGVVDDKQYQTLLVGHRRSFGLA